MITSIHTIDSGLFKLDGGAMFGVVPKSMWHKLNPPDENNMCTWALRCLLIQTDTQNILIDTGMGDKQDEKFRSHFYPHGDGNLLKSLKAKGLEPEHITDVILTHLHFDHCGGAVTKSIDGKLIPTFPKAKYWTNQSHWDWAINPNERERNSFLKENFVPLLDHGVLRYIDDQSEVANFSDQIRLHFCNGHTKALMVVEFDFNNQNYIYPADLFPSSFHIPIPYVMAYDVEPLKTLSEKKKILNLAMDKNSIMIFEHDPQHIACNFKLNESGRISINNYHSF